jgi:hypothetical protein
LNLVALLACTVPVPIEEPAATVSNLWAAVLAPGPITLGPVVVTSPRTLSGTAFFVQDPGGGPATGMPIAVVGFQEGVPPAMGTLVYVTGGWAPDLDGVPALQMDNELDVGRAGGETDIAVLPFTGALEEVGSPVSLGAVEVTSGVDPTGGADVRGGIHVEAVFGDYVGGWAEAAQAAGIALALDRVAPRTPADWQVTRAARDPEVVALVDIPGVDEGTPVVIEGAVQAAPWSEDGRWTAIQSGEAGLWIDTEGWGVAHPAEGDLARWQGEVRRGTDGLRLRTWIDPVVSGAGAVLDGVLAEGARVVVPVTGIGAADGFGARPTDQGFALDDRLMPLDDLPLSCTASGIGRVGPGGDLQLAPFACD